MNRLALIHFWNPRSTACALVAFGDAAPEENASNCRITLQGSCTLANRPVWPLPAELTVPRQARVIGRDWRGVGKPASFRARFFTPGRAGQDSTGSRADPRFWQSCVFYEWLTLDVLHTHAVRADIQLSASSLGGLSGSVTAWSQLLSAPGFSVLRWDGKEVVAGEDLRPLPTAAPCSP